jgi:hypothetical protein
MAYQYVFQEGLEISLVGEKDLPPISLGQKVLELGLNKFTGRLIVTKQAFQQFALDNYVMVNEEKKEGSDSSSSSSEDTTPVRRPRHSAAPKPQSPPQSRSKAEQEDSPRYRVEPESPKPQSTPESTTRAKHEDRPRRRDENETSSQNGDRENQSKENGSLDVISRKNRIPPEGESQSSPKQSTSEDPKLRKQSTARTKQSMKRRKKRAPSVKNSKQIDEFASAFVRKKTDVPKRVRQRPSFIAGDISIDESVNSQDLESPSPSASKEDSKVNRSSRRQTEPPVRAISSSDNPLDQFTEAFSVLSGPPKKIPPTKIEYDTIDEDDDDNDSSGDMEPQSKQSSASDTNDQAKRGRQNHLGGIQKLGAPDDADPLSQFATAFAELSGNPKQVPKSGDASIDDEDEVDEDNDGGESKTPFPSGQHTNRSRTIHDEASSGSEDPLTQFEKVYEEYSMQQSGLESFSVRGRIVRPDTGIAAKGIIKGNPPRVQGLADPPAHRAKRNSPASVSDISLRSQRTSPKSQGSADPPAHLSPPTAAATTAKRVVKVVKKKQPTNGAGKKIVKETMAPMPPGSPQTKKPIAKKKVVKKIVRKVKPSGMTEEKKKKIRALFPQYPAGGNGSLDPVGAFLHKKFAAPLEETLKPKDLEELLECFPFSAYCADERGRLPLHTLGENMRLQKNPDGRQRATELAKLLIKAYPESIRYPDSRGKLPFIEFEGQISTTS